MHMANNKSKFISTCRNDVATFNMRHSIVIGRSISKGERYKPESRYNMIVWAKLESLPLVHLNLLTGDVFNGDPIKSVYAVSASKLFTFSSNDR